MSLSSFADIEGAILMALSDASVDSNSRAAAQAKVNALGENLDAMPTLQALLDNSKHDLVTATAANALQKLASSHWNSFSTAQRVDMRKFC